MAKSAGRSKAKKNDGKPKSSRAGDRANAKWASMSDSEKAPYAAAAQKTEEMRKAGIARQKAAGMPDMSAHGGVKMSSGGTTATTPAERGKMIDAAVKKIADKKKKKK